MKIPGRPLPSKDRGVNSPCAIASARTKCAGSSGPLRGGLSAIVTRPSTIERTRKTAGGTGTIRVSVLYLTNYPPSTVQGVCRRPVVAWGVVSLVGLLALLLPALVNGFPLVFADTGGYLARPFEG